MVGLVSLLVCGWYVFGGLVCCVVVLVVIRDVSLLFWWFGLIFFYGLPLVCCGVDCLLAGCCG